MRTFFGLLILLLSANSANAAVLYYANSPSNWDSWSNSSWNTLGNWWQDAEHTVPASGLPQAGDTLYVDGDLLVDVPAISLSHVYAGEYNTDRLIGVVLDGVTSDITFKSFARLSGGTVTGNAVFYDHGSSRGTVNGNAVHMSASSSTFILSGNMGWGNVTGSNTDKDGNVINTFIFNDYSHIGRDATATGTVVLNDYASASGKVIGPLTLNGYAELFSDYVGDPVFHGNSNLDAGAVITGDPIFYDDSQNENGTVEGDPEFHDRSLNWNIVNGNPTFYDSSENRWEVNGDATFVGDVADNYRTVTGTKTRRYEANATTTRDFVSIGPWTIVASGATVDVSGATYDPTTVFLAENGGSFNPEMAPNVSILSPISGQDVKAWKPSVAWGNATSCLYSLDGGSFTSLDCAKGGSDIPTPFASGSHNLTIKASSTTGASTASVSFIYSKENCRDRSCQNKKLKNL